MLKRYLRLPGEAVWLTGLLVVSLLVTGCGGAAQEPEVVLPTSVGTETAVAEAVEATAEQETATEEVAEVEETTVTADSDPQDEATAAVEEANLPAEASTAPAECQTMNIPDNGLIAAVSEQDWAKGPANAPVTLIEYGDFQ